MSLHQMQKKYQFILSFEEDPKFILFFSKVKNAVFRHDKIPSGTKYAVWEALIYALLKHYGHRHAPLFAESLLSMLQRDFAVPKDLGLTIIDDLMLLIKDKSRESTSEDDYRFLKNLFAHVAASEDDETISVDLGLGRDILEQLRKSIEIVSAIQDSEADAPLMFLPEMDSQVATIMLEFNAEVAQNSSAIQHYLIKSLCLPYREQRSSVLKDLAPFIFDTLVQIGIGQLSTTRDIINFMLNFPLKQGDVHANLTPLLEYDLAYTDGPQNEDRTRWFLTPFAKVLTKDAYARHFLTNNPDILNKLSDVPLEYQTSVLKSLPGDSLESLKQIALRVRPLSPKSFTYIWTQMKNAGKTFESIKIAKTIWRNDRSSLVKRVVLKSLLEVEECNLVDRIFQEVAQSEDSFRVSALGQTIEESPNLEEDSEYHGHDYDDLTHHAS